jgi:hypothetical protein
LDPSRCGEGGSGIAVFALVLELFAQICLLGPVVMDVDLEPDEREGESNPEVPENAREEREIWVFQGELQKWRY